MCVGHKTNKQHQFILDMTIGCIMKYIKYLIRLVLTIVVILIIVTSMLKAEISIAYKTDSPLLKFAADKLDEVLKQIDPIVFHHDLSDVSGNVDILVFSNKYETKSFPNISFNTDIKKEGYQILKLKSKELTKLCITAGDESGAMYGILDVAEQIKILRDLTKVKEKLLNPRFPFRAIKFNLPWSPYRAGTASEIHLSTCRDLKYWERFLDMMAENRFNVLSLWNQHPFTFMIRPKNFPKACLFNDEELIDWQYFWRSLFRMAKERGIETYIVNWNIVVSPEFAEAYGAKERNDTSEIVKRYTRECVEQVINEYDDLTGLGVTLADWMEGMNPKEKEDWIEETFIEGMKNAKRRVKFIHRSVLTASPTEMRRVIDNAEVDGPVWVEVKFNWSHGYSTPNLTITHDYSSGNVDERFWKPTPENYKIVWMIRNEDFFVLRWGDPDFIRRHIAINGKEYVGGYFIGSEGYIPAKDYSHKNHSHQTWQYGFEKQWLLYKLWGYLLYNPETPDSVFESEFKFRYGIGIENEPMQAYKLASRMPLRLSSFHAATWDFTLYSEGFLAPRKALGISDGVSSFISIDEFIDHPTLERSYISIKDYVKTIIKGDKFPKGLTTPLQLANDSEKDSRELLILIEKLREKVTPFSGALECEIDDLEAWAYLSLYFAEKLRAGTALELFRKIGMLSEKEKAVANLERAAEFWENVVKVTDKHYSEMPYVAGDTFIWSKFRNQIQRDIEIAKKAEREVKY